MKKILYLCQYFNTPEEGGLLRPWAVSRHLKEKGYEVIVVAASSHHMTEKNPENKKNSLINSEMINGIKVIKLYSYPSYRDGFMSRLLYYILYPFLAFFVALRQTNVDIIIVSTPPTFLLISGYLASIIKNKKLFVEVRDAWLEFALRRKLIPKFLVRPLFFIQKHIFIKSNKIISVTPGIKDIVDTYTGDKDKNILVMNGHEVDVDTANIKLSQEILDNYNLKDKFIVIYTGTLGQARDHEIFCRAANLLREYEEIIFLIVGEGEKKKEFVQFVESNQLSNVTFMDLQPRQMMPILMGISHIGINSIRKNDCLESSLSNKIFEYLGNKLPVIWAGEGDTNWLINKAGGGICVDPENEDQFANAILQLYKNNELRVSMALSGHEYIIKNFTRDKVMKPLDTIL